MRLVRPAILLTAVLCLAAMPAPAAEPLTFDLRAMSDPAWPYASRIQWRGPIQWLMLKDGSIVEIRDEQLCGGQDEDSEDQPLDIEQCKSYELAAYSDELGFALFAVQLYDAKRWMLLSLADGSRSEIADDDAVLTETKLTIRRPTP